ncbi:MAG: hypothetical protein PVG54_16445, partial [Anaerolineae bacterium]
MIFDTQQIQDNTMHGGNGRAAPNGALLSIQDLRVWFELRRWGFGHAGYVRAVDGVSFSLGHGEAVGVV